MLIPELSPEQEADYASRTVRPPESVDPYGTMDIPGLPHPFRYRLDRPNDQVVIRESFDENCYRIQDFYVKPGGLVLDIGANVGAFALYARSRFRDADIICFEPEPANHIVLAENLSCPTKGDCNCHYERFFPIPEGVMETAGQYQLYSDDSGSTLNLGHDFRPERKLKTVSIFCAEFREVLNRFTRWNGHEVIDLLKVDTEGAEYSIFAGLDEFTLNCVNHIVIEFHAPPFCPCAYTPEEVRTKFGEMIATLTQTHHVETLGSVRRGGYIYAHRYGL
jgi:FkbM family methyltransferase